MPGIFYAEPVQRLAPPDEKGGEKNIGSMNKTRLSAKCLQRASPKKNWIPIAKPAVVTSGAHTLLCIELSSWLPQLCFHSIALACGAIIDNVTWFGRDVDDIGNRRADGTHIISAGGTSAAPAILTPWSLGRTVLTVYNIRPRSFYIGPILARHH